MEKHLAELDPEVAEIMVGALFHFLVENASDSSLIVGLPL